MTDNILRIKESDLSAAIECVLLDYFSDAEAVGIELRQSQARWLARRAIDRLHSGNRLRTVSRPTSKKT